MLGGSKIGRALWHLIMSPLPEDVSVDRSSSGVQFADSVQVIQIFLAQGAKFSFKCPYIVEND